MTENQAPSLKQKLIFVTGKGGVGRTTVASALGLGFAEAGENTLIVQWSFRDFISPQWNRDPCGHKHVEIQKNLSVMNFDPSEAMKEYFVDHLNMKLLYNLVLQNKQVISMNWHCMPYKWYLSIYEEFIEYCINSNIYVGCYRDYLNKVDY